VVADGLISGRFRLGELLGTGGSASVFAAVDVRDDSAVALKILHPHLADDPAAREALFAEARAASGLRHPNIVRVLDTGVDDDARAWISLELVAGASLTEVVDERGALDQDEALAVARGILLGLEAAHAAGLVHRDIAPGNIMVSTGAGDRVEAADVRLVDFGLADAAGRSALARAGDQASGVVGNVNYLSPEQAEGREIDARGDIYQVGAVLYFALTGRAPFERATIAETMRAHLSAPPPVPSVRRVGVSRGVDRLVVKAMLKGPDARFASAGEMLAAIDVLAATPGAGDARTRLLGAPAVSRHVYTTRMTAVHTPPVRSAVSRPVVVDPVPEPPAAAPPRSPAWGLVGALAVAVAVIAWILSATAVPPPRLADAATVSTPVATSASPTPAAQSGRPRVEPVAVPDVAGITAPEAGALLERAGLAVGATAAEDSAAPAGTVLRSSPAAASAQPPGTPVDLVVASGSNTVPAVAGLPREVAIETLQAAGFAIQFAVDSTTGRPGGTVLASDPADGSSLTLGRPVTVVVAGTPAPTAPPTTSPMPDPTGTAPPTPGG
jgi:tRNA A-37 threonylcarbamoyl transferase component Bud32